MNHRNFVNHSITFLFWVALASPQTLPSVYILGADDELTVNVLDLKDIGAKPARIDLEGNIDLPLVGRVHAGGLTVEQLKTELTARLRKYLKKPQVNVAVTEFRSQPVSVLGAINKPGVHQLQGRKTLFEVLSMAEGLRTDAGNKILISRHATWGKIPLPQAGTDESGKFSVAEVLASSIMAGKNPGENIQIMPNDVISVPRADLIYVVGSVRHSGGFVLGERERLSVLQALSLAEGLDASAAPQRAKIIRHIEGSTNRTEIAVNLKKVLTGKSEDVALQANDILFVPSNGPKAAGLRALEAAVQMSTGLVIYRRW